MLFELGFYNFIIILYLIFNIFRKKIKFKLIIIYSWYKYYLCRPKLFHKEKKNQNQNQRNIRSSFAQRL